MTQHRLPLDDAPAHYPPAPRGVRKLQLSTTIAFVVLFALAVIAVSIGIAQAETLGAMVDDEEGRRALLGLVGLTLFAGTVTAMVMWLTAPAPPQARDIGRI
jgi:hypothetical protein